MRFHVFGRHWSHIQYQMCTSCFCKDIDPIFNAKFPFHVLLKIFIPSLSFSWIYKTDLRGCSAQLFPAFSETWRSRCWDVQMLWKKIWVFGSVAESGCLQNQNNWFLSPWTRPINWTAWKRWVFGFSKNES